MPLQIQNWPGREGAIQLCSFEVVENKAFICDECGIHEDGSVPTIWCEFPRGHKDKLTYHKECFITILRKATKDKNVARCVEDEFLATMLKNIRASIKEDTEVPTVTVSIPLIEQLSEAEPVIQQLSDTKAENQSLKQLGFSLEDLGASDESAMKAEMLRKAIKKKKNHYTKQKQEETEDGPSNPSEDAPSSRPEMKPQDMSITEKKRLTCFYYYGGERRVLSNSTFDYVGGVSGAMLIEDDVSNEELLSRIVSRLSISLHNKLIFHNTKRDKTKYLRVRDTNGVKMMFYLNEDEVDVFVEEHAFDTSTRESNIVESNKTPKEKKRLTCFCYWNGSRLVLPNGTFEYRNGVSEAVLIEDDMSYDELLSKICSSLNISTDCKLVFYNSKRDKTKKLRVKDGNGVELLFHMNEEEVDVFVEEDHTSIRDSRWESWD